VTKKVVGVFVRFRAPLHPERNRGNSAALGTIAIDSIFTPIKNVKYSIENYRVEQKLLRKS
jgi:DNA-directed RNA polymerase subunit alpha